MYLLTQTSSVKNYSLYARNQRLFYAPFVIHLFYLTPPDNLCELIFGLTPFGWLRSITLTPYF